MDDGWEASASVWIAAQGSDGDFTRKHVLDPVMHARIAARSFQRAIDIGCGEGRFCRFLGSRGIVAVGIDPAPSLIAEARRRESDGDYRLGRAELLEFDDASFDLVVSYLSLIDIADVSSAIGEMNRVLAPGGTLLIANLASFNTAAVGSGWVKSRQGRKRHFAIDRYLTERSVRTVWEGMSVINWHRPLSTYMKLLLGQGLRLSFFDEPEPVGGDEGRVESYRRLPWAYVMEWRKA